MSEQQNKENDELELNIDFSKYFKPEVREFFKKNRTLLSFMGIILLAAVFFGGSKFYNSYKSKQVASINGEAASTSQNVDSGTTGETGTTVDTENQVAVESSDSAKPAIAKLPFTGRGISYVVKNNDNTASIIKNICGSEAKGYVETIVRNLNKIYPGQVLEITCR